MKKTTALLATTAATAAAITTALHAASSDTPQSALRTPHSPNIIFILTDDLGYGDLGAFWQNARRDAATGLAAHATPQLDRMAAEGAKLTNHYCAAPVSVASRVSLLSGLSQGHTPVRDNQFDKALPDNHTLATILKQAGYATAAIGKWGLHGDDETTNAKTKDNANSAPSETDKPKTKTATKGKTPAKNAAKSKSAPKSAPAPLRVMTYDWPAVPTKRGFDYYLGYLRHVDGHEHYPKEQVYFTPEKRARGPIALWDNGKNITDTLDNCYTTDLFAARAKQWIIDHQKTTPAQPFFIYLAFDTPHAVLELPPCPYPPGGGLTGGLQWLGAPGHMINTATGAPDTYMHPDYANATYTRNGKQLPWPNVYKRYATSVRRIDDAVGDILQLLRDLAIDNNTIVIFTSDNGPSQESYLPEDYEADFFHSFGPFDGIKRDTWEGGMREPTIIRWPGHIPPGTTDPRPSINYDWLPTFADAAGLPAPANADGITLLPGLTGKGKLPARDSFYIEYMNKSKTPAYTAFEPSRRNRMRGQMQAIRLGDHVGVRYDIQKPDDPFEIYNVVTDPKEARNLAATPEGAALQARFQALALQTRRPEPTAPRPYDNELIPAIASAPAKTASGLAWSYYQGDFPWVPNTDMLDAKKKGISPALDLAPLNGKQNAALRFTGYLNVPADGDYTFALTTNGGAVMRLHEALLFDADKGYAPGTEKTAQIRLKAGLHPITLTVRAPAAGASAPALTLKWSAANDTQLHLIPATAFSH